MEDNVNLTELVMRDPLGALFVLILSAALVLAVVSLFRD